MSFVYYRNKLTSLIEGKFHKCDTKSKLFTDPLKYDRFVSNQDLAVQVAPTPSPVEGVPDIILKSPNGANWKVSVNNTGLISVAPA